MRMMMMRRRLEFSSGLSRRWLTSTIVPRSNWNLECWFKWRRENWRTRRKNLGARTRTHQKLNTHVISGPGVEPQPQLWEASAHSPLLHTAPHRSPNLFQFIYTSLVFNIFNLLNSFLCFFRFCFCFCFNLLSCNKINVEVLVEKITSCFRCNSRAQLLFFNFQFLASIKCLKSIQFHLKARLTRLICVPKKKKYNNARYLEKWLMLEQLNYVARAGLHASDNLVAKLLSSWGRIVPCQPVVWMTPAWHWHTRARNGVLSFARVSCARQVRWPRRVEIKTHSWMFPAVNV